MLIFRPDQTNPEISSCFGRAHNFHTFATKEYFLHIAFEILNPYPYHPWDCYIYLHENHKISTIHGSVNIRPRPMGMVVWVRNWFIEYLHPRAQGVSFLGSEFQKLKSVILVAEMGSLKKWLYETIPTNNWVVSHNQVGNTEIHHKHIIRNGFFLPPILIWFFTLGPTYLDPTNPGTGFIFLHRFGTWSLVSLSWSLNSSSYKWLRRCWWYGCWEFVLTWGPLNHQKQTWGLKFNTLGGSRDDEDDDHLYKGWQFWK